MSSCNNSSNLSGNVNINSITNSGARLLMTIPISGVSGGFGAGGMCAYGECDGVTAGDVIRYDPSASKYVKSKADKSENSEVVGVIETADWVNNVINVVLHGQIKYPSDRFINATHVDEAQGLLGASGGNDIYFLSEITGGVLQNLAPSTPTTIAKPVLQVAEDGDFNANVVNYIGYQIGGNAVAEETFEEPVGAARSIVNFNEDQLNSLGIKWHRIDKETFLPITSEDLHASAYNGRLYSKAYSNFKLKAGVRIKCKISEYINNTDVVGKVVTQKDSIGNIIGSWNVVSFDVENNVLWLQGTRTNNVDVNFSLRFENKGYTVLSSEITAFMLPRKRTKINTEYNDYHGRSLTIDEIPVISATPDDQGVGVTLVHDMVVPKLTITKEFNAENNSIKVTDVAGTLNDMKDSIRSLENKINNSQTAFPNITTK